MEEREAPRVRSPVRWLGYLAAAAAPAAATYLVLCATADDARSPDAHFAVMVGVLNLSLAGIAMHEARPRLGLARLVWSGLLLLLVAAWLVEPRSHLLAAPNCLALIFTSADLVWSGGKSILAWVRMRTTRSRRWFGAGILALVAVAALPAWLGGVAALLQLQVAPAVLRYLPRERVPLAPRERRVVLATSDGHTLPAVFLAGRPGQPAIILCHGLGDQAASQCDLAYAFHVEGYQTLRFDFRAHGGATGALTTICHGELRDIAAAVEWLRIQPEASGAPLFLFGVSLGAGIALRAVELPELAPIAGVVALAPPADFPEIARRRFGGTHLLARVLAWHTLAATRFLAGVDLRASGAGRQESGRHPPLLIFASVADEVIPFEQAEAIARAAGTSATFVRIDGATHVMLPGAVLDTPEHMSRILAFLAAHR